MDAWGAFLKRDDVQAHASHANATAATSSQGVASLMVAVSGAHQSGRSIRTTLRLGSCQIGGYLQTHQIRPTNRGHAGLACQSHVWISIVPHGCSAIQSTMHVKVRLRTPRCDHCVRCLSPVTFSNGQREGTSLKHQARSSWQQPASIFGSVRTFARVKVKALKPGSMTSACLNTSYYFWPLLGAFFGFQPRSREPPSTLCEK
jgi:hypothetical protein